MTQFLRYLPGDFIRTRDHVSPSKLCIAILENGRKVVFFDPHRQCMDEQRADYFERVDPER